MGTPSFHEFTRQASFFLKDKIRNARLTLTDVTPAQLLTEEATNGDPSAPDTRTMGLISRAAFEVDDYWRIVDVLHKRLSRFEKNSWRSSYKALILLEHLLTHGPERVAEEFQREKDDVIRDMKSFQYIDEKGFNWGMSIRKKSETLLKLLQDVNFLKEERARARKLTIGIKGFGSFCQRSSIADGSLQELSEERYGRCNSHNYIKIEGGEVLVQDDAFSAEERIYETQKPDEFTNSILENIVKNPNARLGIEGEQYTTEVNHPFCDNDNQSVASLLSSKG